MSFAPNFTATQASGQPSIVTITDISTGSDGNITQRRVYLRKDDGTFLVPEGTPTEYIQWAYADPSIAIDALDKDYGLTIIVQWLNVSNAVLYDKTITAGLTLYNETYDYGLTQKLSGNPLLINDNGFWERKSTLRAEIDSGNQAISFAEDTFSAQQCYDLATAIRLNYP